jgi:hypothetical protein
MQQKFVPICAAIATFFNRRRICAACNITLYPSWSSQKSSHKNDFIVANAAFLKVSLHHAIVEN